jgi:hypothetical protein
MDITEKLGQVAFIIQNEITYEVRPSNYAVVVSGCSAIKRLYGRGNPYQKHGKKSSTRHNLV